MFNNNFDIFDKMRNTIKENTNIIELLKVLEKNQSKTFYTEETNIKFCVRKLAET